MTVIIRERRTSQTYPRVPEWPQHILCNTLLTSCPGLGLGSGAVSVLDDDSLHCSLLGPHINISRLSLEVRNPDNVDTIVQSSWHWPWGLTLCFIGILSPKTFSQVSVFRKGTIILYFAQDLSEIITFNLTTSIMSLVKYVFYFYWPGGILSTWAVSMPKNCFLENKINLSGII